MAPWRQRLGWRSGDRKHCAAHRELMSTNESEESASTRNRRNFHTARHALFILPESPAFLTLWASPTLRVSRFERSRRLPHLWLRIICSLLRNSASCHGGSACLNSRRNSSGAVTASSTHSYCAAAACSLFLAFRLVRAVNRRKCNRSVGLKATSCIVRRCLSVFAWRQWRGNHEDDDICAPLSNAASYNSASS